MEEKSQTLTVNSCENKLMNFDDVIPYIGGCGRYQLFLFCALWASVLVACFPAFNLVFTAAAPDHWCRVRALENSGLTEEQIKNLSIPWETRDGKQVLSQCEFYDIDYVVELRGERVPPHVQLLGDDRWPKAPCRDGWLFDKTWYGSTVVTEVSRWLLTKHT